MRTAREPSIGNRRQTSRLVKLATSRLTSDFDSCNMWGSRCKAASSMSIPTLLVLVMAIVSVSSSGIHDSATRYSAELFKEKLDSNNHFVMFYAPWCGHCQRLAPTWLQLEEFLNVDESRVTIASVDCTSEADLCAQQDITGYPTLKFFKAGSHDGVKFRGIRDLPNLSSFINEQLGESSVEEHLRVPIKESTCVELTDDTFYTHIAHGYHFVKFYAPWCGHCQRLAPTWDSLADTFSHDKAVSVSKIDCTVYKKICNEFDIKGYPTILWIEDGKMMDRYDGKRSHDEFKKYIDSMIQSDLYHNKIVSDEEAADGTSVMILTANNFENGLQNGYVFVKFFTPWCGHCKRLAPTWEELGRKFISHTVVKIAKVDCSVETNRELCNMRKVNGFPSLYLYKNGVQVAEYDGSRSLDDLYDFVMEKAVNAHDEL